MQPTEAAHLRAAGRDAAKRVSNTHARSGVSAVRTDAQGRAALRDAHSSARPSPSASYRQRHGMSFQVFTPILEEPPGASLPGTSSPPAGDAAPPSPPPLPPSYPLQPPTSSSGFFYFKDVVEAQSRGDILAVGCFANTQSEFRSCLTTIF